MTKRLNTHTRTFPEGRAGTHCLQKLARSLVYTAHSINARWMKSECRLSLCQGTHRVRVQSPPWCQPQRITSSKHPNGHEGFLYIFYLKSMSIFILSHCLVDMQVSSVLYNIIHFICPNA